MPGAPGVLGVPRVPKTCLKRVVDIAPYFVGWLITINDAPPYGRVAMKRVPLPEQGAGQPNFDPLGPLATQPIVSRARKRPAEPLIAIPRPRRKSKYQKPLGSKFKMRSRRIQSKRTQSKQIQPKQIQFQIGSNPTRRERFVTQDQPRNICVTKCRKKVICARKL